MNRPASRFKVIRGALVLDSDRRTAVPGDLLIDGASIAEIGQPGMEVPVDAETIDATNRFAIPGLVNMHTHGHGVMGRGLLPEKAGLEVFLAGAGATMRQRTADDKYLGGMVNALEMVSRGITTCFDMFAESPLPSREGIEAIGRAYDEVGMRAVIAPMVSDRTIFEALPGMADALEAPLREKALAQRASGTAEIVDALTRLYRDWPLGTDRVIPGVAPTIPLHCSDDLLLSCRDLARDLGAPMQIHLAETEMQARAGIARYGRSLTAHLDRLGMLAPNLSLAHSVWLSAEDMQRIAGGGASAVHNPTSNLRLGSGIARVSELRRTGVPVCLGTDGCNTSDHMNMFEVQRLAAGLSRVVDHEVDCWLSSAEVLEMATETGARAIGGNWRIGRLEKGYLADIVLVDLTKTQYWPLRDPLTQLVFSEDGSGVSEVFVGGRQLLSQGRHVGIDLERVRKLVQDAADRIEESSRADRMGGEEMERQIETFVASHKRLGSRCSCCSGG